MTSDAYLAHDPPDPEQPDRCHHCEGPLDARGYCDGGCDDGPRGMEDDV